MLSIKILRCLATQLSQYPKSIKGLCL